MRKKVKHICAWCSKPIARKDEIALCRKLISVDTHLFYCLSCFAEYCGCSVEELEEKIEEFKAEGCTLFQ